MAMKMPEIEIDSRPRDELTDRLIKEALEDEERRKREKKGLPPQGGPAPGARAAAAAPAWLPPPPRPAGCSLPVRCGAHLANGSTVARARSRGLARAGRDPNADAVPRTRRPSPPTTHSALREAAKRPHKGKTLAEIEEEEGGPVRESLVGMAHTKRAQRRRAGAGPGDTDIPDDIAAAEEFNSGDEEEEEEDGEGRGDDAGPPRKRQRGAGGKAKKGGGAAEPAPLPGGDAAPLTAFNLNEERQEGHFDEEGNFVFDKGDPDNRDDEWLKSDEGGCGGWAGGPGTAAWGGGPVGVSSLLCGWYAACAGGENSSSWNRAARAHAWRRGHEAPACAAPCAGPSTLARPRAPAAGPARPLPLLPLPLPFPPRRQGGCQRGAAEARGGAARGHERGGRGARDGRGAGGARAAGHVAPHGAGGDGAGRAAAAAGRGRGAEKGCAARGGG